MRSPKVARVLKKDFVVVKINFYSSQGKKFKIKTTPTLLYFTPQGKKIHRHTGFITKDKLIEHFQKVKKMADKKKEIKNN